MAYAPASLHRGLERRQFYRLLAAAVLGCWLIDLAESPAARQSTLVVRLLWMAVLLLAAVAVRGAGPLILCDVVMPGMEGIELRDRIVACWPGCEPRIVFMTGGIFSERVRRILADAPSGWLNKPFERAQLDRLLAGAERAAA